MEHMLKKNPILSLFAKSELFCFILTAVILLITSLLMMKLDLGSSTLSIIIIITYIVVNLLGGLIIGKGMEHRKFMWGLIHGGVYFLLLFVISILVVSTKEFHFVTYLRTLAICALSGMVGGMIS